MLELSEDGRRITENEYLEHRLDNYVSQHNRRTGVTLRQAVANVPEKRSSSSSNVENV